MSDRLKETFQKIKADDELKRHTTEYIFQKTRGYQKNVFLPYKLLAAVMVCFLSVLAGFGWYSAYFTPTSAISVDVNPSIELNINRFDKVISVETYNDDGYIVMSSTDIRFKDYREALHQILSSESMAQYLTKDCLIAITVFGADEEKNNEIITNLSSCAASYGNVHCAHGNSEEAAAAHAHGMSFGKYEAFLELKALAPDITAEEANGLSMCQIQDLINELSNGAKDSTQDIDTNNDNIGHSSHHGDGSRDTYGNYNGHGHR